MRAFKKIDLLIQVMLVIVFTIIEIVHSKSLFILALYILGGWQLISMLIHWANKWHPMKGGRRFSFQIVFVALFVLASLAELVFQKVFLQHFLLFTLPVLSIYYSYICYMEIFYYSKRPLELI
ncbi:MAG: hypothetical protein JWQ40_3487 [Segetibacter sp.]|nr:hypothetical protein [Segetibacter sp.]